MDPNPAAQPRDPIPPGSSLWPIGPGSSPGRPLVIAHRGDSAHAPENTLHSARGAHAAGADAWELDVQLTRDGIPVVIHDDSLARTTDVAVRHAGDPRAAAGFLVADFDLHEIRALDAGSWFLDPRGVARSASGFGTIDLIPEEDRRRFGSGAIRVPTLDEALTLTVGLDWLVNVELKSFPISRPELVGAVLEVIDRLGCAERVLISSFDHADIARIKHSRGEIAAGVLAESPLYRPADYVRGLVGADSYHPSTRALGAESGPYRAAPSAESLRSADLSSLRAAGLPVFAYTVNEVRPRGLADHLAAAGVAGLFTDFPGALVARWSRPTSIHLVGPAHDR